MRRLPLYLLFLFFLSSCVPTKKLVYLKWIPIDEKEIHKIKSSPYKLQVGDNIIIDVKSDNNRLIAAFLKSTTITRKRTTFVKVSKRVRVFWILL